MPRRAFAELTRLANERFNEYLQALPGETPPHRVAFSRRITGSWALIYFRRRLVRLSPFLFLLPRDRLRHGTHWRELDATLRHEAAHAYVFHHFGETGHTERFHDALAALGVRANGTCDLGPENAAYRYLYGCGRCGSEWPRRAPLKGNWSCGACAPGRYSPDHRVVLLTEADPWARVVQRVDRVQAALSEAKSVAAHPAAPVPATPAAEDLSQRASHVRTSTCERVREAVHDFAPQRL